MIAIYYEHPEWFRPLFEELDRRGVPYVRIDASRHQYDTSAREDEYALLFNRMSASAYLRGHANAIFYTRNYLEHLERKGVRVINGRESFAVETSKALQLSLFESLGLPYPRTRIINNADEAVNAARDLRFPIVVKPNIGGRGAGIVRYETIDALTRAVEEGRIELGIDSTALVQEFSPARNGHIARVETLNGKYLYAIKVFTTGESFNLCPAEICQIEDGVSAIGEVCLVDAPKSGLKVEACEPGIQSMISALLRVTPSGMPLAIPLAIVMMSGSTPVCCTAHHLPVRPQPACTSSQISRMPCVSQMRRSSCMNSGGAGMYPPSPCCASTMMAATSSGGSVDLNSRSTM